MILFLIFNFPFFQILFYCCSYSRAHYLYSWVCSPISGLLPGYFDTHLYNCIMFFMSVFLHHINTPSQNVALCNLIRTDQINWYCYLMILWWVLLGEITTQVSISCFLFYTELVLVTPILYPIKTIFHGA